MLEREQDRLRKLAEIEEQNQRASRQFLSRIDAKVKTPLECIAKCTDLLKGMTSDDEENEYLTCIADSTVSLSGIWEDAIDISKYVIVFDIFDATQWTPKALTTVVCLFDAGSSSENWSWRRCHSHFGLSLKVWYHSVHNSVT